MLKYLKGDLFKTDIPNIAHGCNTAGVMGSGVAAVVKKKFPKTFKKYVEFCTPQLGQFMLTKPEHAAEILGKTLIVEENGKTIFNMMTQGDWSRAFGTDTRYASYDAIDECFQEANRNIRTGSKTLAIPMIGAGLGGGNWKVIERIIEEATPDIEVTVYQL